MLIDRRSERRAGAHGARWRPSRPWIAAVGAVSILAISFSAALAFWSATRSGAATGTTGSFHVSLVGLAGVDTPSSTLVPGGQADLVLKVNNPQSSNVRLTSVVANGSASADAGHSGCTTTGVSLGALSSLPVTLTPGTSVVHLTNGVAMSAASESGCQGATFSVPVTITVQS